MEGEILKGIGQIISTTKNWKWKIKHSAAILLGLIIITIFSGSIENVSTVEEGKFLDKVELGTFLFFYENTDEHGFTIESTAWPTGSSASSGFYLTSIPIAIERGWITYEDGYRRAVTTINSYYDDPTDPDDFYVESKHGFFPHWFDQKTGKWNGVDCFSSIDTAIFMAGVLTASQYFAGTEIEAVAKRLYLDVDWQWMLNGNDTLSMGWRPDTGFLSSRWQGYNEGMLAVLLALGSPTHPIPENSWDAWAKTYRQVEYNYGNQSYRFVESTSTSLFTYQYPHIWFDFREKTDKIGVNYFQNSVNATFENRAYVIKNPNNHEAYGPNIWGLTASECPLHDSFYGSHGPRQSDDGTIAPAGAAGSIVFTPQQSIEALRQMNESYGSKLWGKYGFKDAFNPGIDWFSPTYIGIDQGATLTMIENYRSGLVQALFMRNEYAKNAMQRGGFIGNDTSPPAITEIKKNDSKITARVIDNIDIRSVSVHIGIEISQYEGIGRPLRGFVSPPSYTTLVEKMMQQGEIYSADIPEVKAKYPGDFNNTPIWYFIEAVDMNGNVASSQRFEINDNNSIILPPAKMQLPSGAPNGSLIVDRFDDCISKGGAGSWQGGTSSPVDSVVMFDRIVNHGETGCSMKIRYNVSKQGAYNGAWIRLGSLDLRKYNELVLWIKGDEKEGYTTTMKIELKSSKGLAVYIVGSVADSWKEIAAPLKEFKPPSGSSEINWSDVTELTIVFEDWRATNKKGVIYIDDIYFAPKIEIPPEPIAPKDASTIIPAIELAVVVTLAIAGLLIVAHYFRKRKRSRQPPHPGEIYC